MSPKGSRKLPEPFTRASPKTIAECTIIILITFWFQKVALGPMSGPRQPPKSAQESQKEVPKNTASHDGRVPKGPPRQTPQGHQELPEQNSKNFKKVHCACIHEHLWDQFGHQGDAIDRRNGSPHFVWKACARGPRLDNG